MSQGLRLIVYDRTQRARAPRSLGYSWQYGSHLYRALGRTDAAYGARDFGGTLRFLASHEPTRQISELQFWGHGKWGKIFVGEHALDRGVLAPTHPHHASFQAFRERLAPDALLWFRTCETLGAAAGQDFAKALSDATGARVAGHTFVIGFFQSGLHCLRPGQAPSWSATEGLARGSARAPEQALASAPDAPNTITCLHGEVPAAF
jgi:hypothetical protein